MGQLGIPQCLNPGWCTALAGMSLDCFQLFQDVGWALTGLKMRLTERHPKATFFHSLGPLPSAAKLDLRAWITDSGMVLVIKQNLVC